MEKEDKRYSVLGIKASMASCCSCSCSLHDKLYDEHGHTNTLWASGDLELAAASLGNSGIQVFAYGLIVPMILHYFLHCIYCMQIKE
ncbi:hypothetical protein SUGI_0342930 [Cryptomeria japonica]|nr:hypothetical protein SUGI_0342930 [Cryptomeria japonica]